MESKKEEKKPAVPATPKWKPYKYKNKYRTGEDIDMLREKNRTRSSERNICDTHIDGA